MKLTNLCLILFELDMSSHEKTGSGQHGLKGTTHKALLRTCTWLTIVVVLDFKKITTLSVLVCVAGFYDDGGSCTPCTVGLYNDQLDQESCTSCPDDKTTLVTGAIAADQCGEPILNLIFALIFC